MREYSLKSVLSKTWNWSEQHPIWSWILGCIIFALVAGIWLGAELAGRIAGIVGFLGVLGIRGTRKAEQKKKAKDTNNVRE